MLFGTAWVGSHVDWRSFGHSTLELYLPSYTRGTLACTDRCGSTSCIHCPSARNPDNRGQTKLENQALCFHKAYLLRLAHVICCSPYRSSPEDCFLPTKSRLKEVAGGIVIRRLRPCHFGVIILSRDTCLSSAIRTSIYPAGILRTGERLILKIVEHGLSGCALKQWPDIF